MKSLFETENQQSILNRIQNLNETSQPNWGKMDVAQMLTHCQKPLEVANGTLQLNTKIGFAKKLLFKLFKSTMYNDKPWRKNLPTAPQLKANEPKDFTNESAILKTLVDEFSALKDRDIWYPHPAFGPFTKEQWGQLQYKHLDHHLKQFGV